MNFDKLKIIIEDARINKRISQRELANISGINRSTLNDLINGKRKKVNIDALMKIAKPLNLSLKNLLKFAGYDELIDYLYIDKSQNQVKE